MVKFSVFSFCSPLSSMGKPFQTELRSLPQTYEWALKLELGPLADFGRQCSDGDLYAIGSGGSLSAAAYAAYLRGLQTEAMTSAVTPLEFCARERLRKSSIIIYSAGGGN